MLDPPHWLNLLLLTFQYWKPIGNPWMCRSFVAWGQWFNFLPPLHDVLPLGQAMTKNVLLHLFTDKRQGEAILIHLPCVELVEETPRGHGASFASPNHYCPDPLPPWGAKNSYLPPARVRYDIGGHMYRDILIIEHRTYNEGVCGGEYDIN